MTEKMTVKSVALELIDPPGYQARTEIHLPDIEELAENIRKNGLLQPILLRPVGDRFEIIAGHRRFLAHKHLDAKAIFAVVKVVDDQYVAITRASENLARVNLTPIEEALTYAELIEKNGMTFGDVARWMGKSPGTVKRRLDLLSMPPSIQKALHDKKISVTVAEELWPISDPDALDYYLQIVVENGATRDVVRQWVHDWKNSRNAEPVAGEDALPFRSPQAPRPYYASCDTCLGPVEIGKEHAMRVCDPCFKIIVNALKEGA